MTLCCRSELNRALQLKDLVFFFMVFGLFAYFLLLVGGEEGV